MFLSVVEDVFTVGLAVLAAFHPLVILAVVIVFLVLAIWLVLYGLASFVSLGLPPPLMGILALVAGVLILAGR